ncbi:MAG: PD40 domain-containing protein [Verrucomicrobia bacterium]|nr:PD40 domain-containing protein [Verrucomicrobiota bacterium]
MAVAFDPDSQKLTGAPFPIAENVAITGYLVIGVFSAALDGTLVQLPASGIKSEFIWYSLAGMRLGTLGDPAEYGYGSVRISPDGKSAAVSIVEQAQGSSDLWIIDTDRNSPMRMTTHARDDFFGIWSRDGKWIVFSSHRKGVVDLYLREVASIQSEKLLLESAEPKFPLSWSPDGKTLLFGSRALKTKADLWILPISQESSKPEPFLNSEHSETLAHFSPDGKWIVYDSDEQRSSEVFAISYPDKRGKVKISNAGGTNPRWSPDGTKIYYQDPDNYLVEVALNVEPSRMIPGVPKRLFQIQPAALYGVFDIAPDGKRFLVNTAPEATNAVPLKVVLNWPLEFQKR